MLNCREATRLISDKLEQPLPFYLKKLLRMHLFMCKHCTAFKNQIKQLHELLFHYNPSDKEAPSNYSAVLPKKSCEHMKSLLKDKSGEN